MSKIIAAAIKFYPKDSKYPQIVCGRRHCDCYEWMFTHKVEYDKITQVHGFLTEDDQFIDRREAAILAFDNGQMLETSETFKRMKKDFVIYDGLAHSFELFSEDLW